ncbi:choline O-acetyltransferase isoform X1 [Ixodes scapularis]
MHTVFRSLLIVLAVSACFLRLVESAAVKDKSKDSEEWDFEFEEHSHDETSTQKDARKDLKATYNAWSIADGDLCKTVQCRPSQECLIQDEETAICVSAKKVKKMKVHRKLVSTYESASLRKFHLGRVDNIRAATSEALTWIQAMCDAVPASEDDRIKFFQAAVNKGTEILTYTVNGEGPDNHLLGLREMARLHEKTVPLFEDKSYADFLRFRLSTSQLATEKSILVGYGPVVPDGYGCSYNICPAHVDFCVSSFFSSPETSSDFFALSLEGSLLQMRELCIKRAQKDAENNAVLPPTAS